MIPMGVKRQSRQHVQDAVFKVMVSLFFKRLASSFTVARTHDASLFDFGSLG